MEQYKKALKTRTWLLTIPITAAVVLGIYDVFFISKEMKDSMILGFQLGAAIGLGILSIACFIRFRVILRDDTKLKIQYNKENDERLKVIRSKAGMPILLITSVGMIIAGMIGGYFNEIIFLTLVAAAMCQMLVSSIVKITCLRKM